MIMSKLKGLGGN